MFTNEKGGEKRSHSAFSTSMYLQAQGQQEKAQNCTWSGTLPGESRQAAPREESGEKLFFLELRPDSNAVKQPEYT